MVRGLNLFKEHFKPFRHQYVIIGGSACDAYFDSVGIEFRATKDLDIVLHVQELDRNFVERFWEFIELGEYDAYEESSGQPKFYRFLNPQKEPFPSILELFSQVPNSLEREKGNRLTRIEVGEDVSGLSAIVLDENYYQLIRMGTMDLLGLSIVAPEYLIPLKAKAFLDLKARKAAGETIDSRNITKHKNDVFRLFRVISQEKQVEIGETVQKDLGKFLLDMETENVVLGNFGITTMTKDAVLSALRSIYGATPQ